MKTNYSIRLITTSLFGLFFLQSIATTPADLRVTEESESRSKVVPVDVDWTAIKMNAKWDNGMIIIDGYLSMEGIKDSPRISLWETEEAMKNRRIFRSVFVDSESAMEIIGAELGRSPEQWSVLHGAYVKITSSFEREKEGLEYISLGKITNIKNISVFNNGLLLRSLNAK